MFYNFSEHCINIINKDKVVLGNRHTGLWIRLSKEVFEILNSSIDNKLSIEDLKLKLYDDEDRDYINRLYTKLFNIGILEEVSNKNIFKPRMVTFDITSRCNLRCTHCCTNSEILNKDILNTKDIKNIIDKVIIYNPESIVLTGGEPMLRDDFLDILQYTKNKYNGKIILATNGTLISSDNIDKLIECVSQVDISLDGVDEKTCSIIRGKGVFNRVINNIKLLKESGFNQITVSMTMSEKTEHLENQFYDLNKRLGTQAHTRRLSPIGRAIKNKSIFLDEGNSELYIPRYIKESNEEQIPICSCRAGKYELFISNNGNLYPCSSFIDDIYKLGNMKDILSIEDVVTEKLFYNDLKTDLDEDMYDCKECKVNLFCWTCRGKLKEIRNNSDALKKRCDIMKPILYKKIWNESISVSRGEINELYI